MIKNLLMIGLGGATGSVIRFLCQKYIYAWYPHPFPLGTFLVNITGCFLIGILYALSERGNILSPAWRMLLITGFCGGFTTFSSFAQENIQLLKAGDFIYFGLYTASSVFLGIIAAYAGTALIKFHG
jgi:CrcB protein